MLGQNFRIIILVLLSFTVLPVVGQPQVNSQKDTFNIVLEKNLGIFDSEEILDISLKFNITEYIRKKPEKEYLDAVLTLNNNSSDSLSFDVRVRTRGVSRLSLCSFPPIRINLANVTTGYSDLDSVKNIKMVTHCSPPGIFDEYVFKEYLVYKLYNIVTDYSFRVRLLRIRYIDTGARTRNFERYGFLIEPLDMLERRMEVEEVEDIVLRYSSFVPDIMDRMSIFQYMIGNTDWQVASYHNINIVKKEGSILGVSIPYDFDYSGFVNTSYALPAENLDIDNVMERVHLGSCRPDSTYARILSEFSENRDEFFKVIEDFPLINSASRKHINRYLDSFYKMFKKDRIIVYLRHTCKEI